jgi:hypothetical protein
MEGLLGRFNVAITQDPRRILNKDHAEMEIRFALKDEFGEHAYKKVTLEQHNDPGSNGLNRTVGSVCILSLKEMNDIHITMENMKTEIRLLNFHINQLTGGKLR